MTQTLAMLESYTWGNFFTFIVISLFIYYLFIAFYYYGESLNRLISGKKQKTSPSLTTSPKYANTAPPIIAESINNQPHAIEEEELEDLADEPSTTTSDIEDADILAKDTYEWENTKAFTMDYRDATEEEENLLENIDVSEPNDSNEDLEGGIPVEDYIDATIELQKEKIDEEKKEATKSVLRRAYFNASYVELHNMNKNAQANIDALLINLTEEGEISLGEIAVYSDYATKASGDEDIQALLNTINN